MTHYAVGWKCGEHHFRFTPPSTFKTLTNELFTVHENTKGPTLNTLISAQLVLDQAGDSLQSRALPSGTPCSGQLFLSSEVTHSTL